MKTFAQRLSRYGAELQGGAETCIRRVACALQPEDVEETRLRGQGVDTPRIALVSAAAATSSGPLPCQGPFATLPDCLACRAGNAYVDLKHMMSNLTTFRCDLFEDPNSPNGPPCDPLTLKERWKPGSSLWGCGRMLANGSLQLRRRPVTCNLTEFSAYVQAWGPRIVQAVEVLDETATRVISEVNTSLRSLVEEHLFAQVDTVLSGADCSFLATHWSELVQGLCFQSVRGFNEIGASYAVCALLALLMVLIMYIVWRCAIDNVNSWMPPPKDRE